jgi:hypothetical protein
MKKYILFLTILSIDLALFCSTKQHKKGGAPTPQQPKAADPTSPERSLSPIKEITKLKLPNTPRLSVADIEAMDALASTSITLAEQFKKSHDEGWVTCTELDETPKTSPLTEKSWLSKFTELPSTWWNDHVTDLNRIEYFARYAGIVRTYIILWQKKEEGKLGLFIEDLNTNNAGEGYRWVDEALAQAVEDQRPEITRNLMKASTPYKKAITRFTLDKVTNFLTELAEKKRKALAQDLEDYVNDISDLSDTIQEAENLNAKIPAISIEKLESSAHETALKLTEFSSGGYLPRKTAQK